MEKLTNLKMKLETAKEKTPWNLPLIFQVMKMIISIIEYIIDNKNKKKEDGK